MNEDFKDKQIEQQQEYINKLENLIFQYGNECATIRVERFLKIRRVIMQEPIYNMEEDILKNRVGVSKLIESMDFGEHNNDFKSVMILRYSTDMTRKAIADLMGVTVDKVRQIEAKALRYIRELYTIEEIEDMGVYRIG